MDGATMTDCSAVIAGPGADAFFPDCNEGAKAAVAQTKAMSKRTVYEDCLLRNGINVLPVF
jgi:hypothetical protein